LYAGITTTTFFDLIIFQNCVKNTIIKKKSMTNKIYSLLSNLRFLKNEF